MLVGPSILGEEVTLKPGQTLRTTRDVWVKVEGGNLSARQVSPGSGFTIAHPHSGGACFDADVSDLRDGTAVIEWEECEGGTLKKRSMVLDLEVKNGANNRF